LAALGKDKKAKMQALLTPEQKDRIEKRMKQGAENAQVRAAANLERMKIRLNLSDEQATRIKTAQTSLREQMKSIRENDNLLPQQKMEQMKTLAMKRQEVVKSVLTPEQLSKFEAMHTHHWGGGDQGRSFQN
jgi:Spy/CpxP family protein refolding chaperone